MKLKLTGILEWRISPKAARFLAVLLLALCFLAAPLHHHEDGGDAFSCPACLFVKTFCALVLGCFVALFRKKTERFLPVWVLDADPGLHRKVFRSRAPPSL